MILLKKAILTGGLLGAMTVGVQASTIFDAVAGSAATAGQYNILAGSNTTSTNYSFDASNETWKSAVNGAPFNVGIGLGVKVQFSSGALDGNLIFENTSAPSGSSYSAMNPTTVTFNSSSSSPGVASVFNAISAATSLSNYYLNNAPGNATTYTGGDLTVSGGGIHYYSVTNGVQLANKTVTFTGSASDIIVINITAGQLQFQNSLVLAGGLSADNVVFNITGTGNFGGNGNSGGVIEADIIDASNRNNSADSSTFEGRVFNVSTNGNLNLVSGFNINGPAPINVAAPEPSSLALLLACGLFGVPAFRRLLTR